MQSKYVQLAAGWILLCMSSTVATYYGSSELYDRLELQKYFSKQSQAAIVAAPPGLTPALIIAPASQDQPTVSSQPEPMPAAIAEPPVPAPASPRASGRMVDARPIDHFLPAPAGKANPRVADPDAGGISREKVPQHQSPEGRAEMPDRTTSVVRDDPRSSEITVSLDAMDDRFRVVQGSLSIVERSLAQRGVGGLNPEIKVKMSEVRGSLAGARRALSAGQVQQAEQILSAVKRNLEYLENYGRN
jgi:hypothetical protein